MPRSDAGRIFLIVPRARPYLAGGLGPSGLGQAVLRDRGRTTAKTDFRNFPLAGLSGVVTAAIFCPSGRTVEAIIAQGPLRQSQPQCPPSPRRPPTGAHLPLLGTPLGRCSEGSVPCTPAACRWGQAARQSKRSHVSLCAGAPYLQSVAVVYNGHHPLGRSTVNHLTRRR
jgi:hypothetical protein